MTEASPIPPPRPDDDEDVHWALSTSSALWGRGDTGEALKWLRRAAETASDQNRDQRSLELFKAAADATTFLAHVRASSAPPAQAAATPPPPMAAAVAPAMPRGARMSSTPAPPRTSSTPAPTRTSSTPAPPRTGGTAPPLARSPHTPGPSTVAPERTSGLPQTPRPPGARGMPAPVAAGRGALKQTLPSEGIETARDAALGGGAGGAAGAASSVPGTPPPRSSAGGPPPTAARRSDRKATLDERFQFPDDEVTMQRDVASLRKPRPVEPGELARVVTDEAAASAMAATSPVPMMTGAAPSPSPGPRGPVQAPAPRSAAGAAGAAARDAAGPTSARTGAGAPPAPAPTPAYPTQTRTILSAGSSARPSGMKTTSVTSPAAASAARSMSRQITRRIETVMPTMDDLDEQTSVLTGEEAELDFDGSETGENAAATDEHRAIDHHEEGQQDEAPEAHAPTDATPDPTPDASRTDEPLYAPSIRPQSADAPAAGRTEAAQAPRPAQWMALRVALRRDAGGVRIEALGLDAAVPPGAVPALVVAHDAATAEALARLLEPR